MVLKLKFRSKKPFAEEVPALGGRLAKYFTGLAGIIPIVNYNLFFR